MSGMYGKDGRRSQSLDWFRRAAAVIPGGIYGHTSPVAGLPDAFPYFAEDAEGCRYRDVDGNVYLDYMCGYGPIILGYHRPEVEAAAAAQRAKGAVFNHPTPVMVELAEALVNRVDFADWAVFAKNGSDVTTWAVQVARQETGRRKVLRIEGSYHGVDAWCTPGHGGILAEDRVHVDAFRWNDLDGFARLVSIHDGDVAAVIVTPYHHPSFAPSVLPDPGFLEGIEQRCRREGIVLILDDIRTGFRLHSGGSHRRFGFTPDIACYCKALGNGWPISAAVGSDGLKEAAGKVFLTGSYWNNGEAMAAALTTIRLIEEEAVPDRLEVLGQRLAGGLATAGRRAGHDFRLTGPAAAPYPFFGDDEDLRKVQAFCGLAVERGVFFHPHHNWFLGAGHDEAVIDETIAIAGTCFDDLDRAVGGSVFAREGMV